MSRQCNCNNNFPISFLSSNRTPENGARMRGEKQREKHELASSQVALLPVYLGADCCAGIITIPGTCLQRV